MNDTEEAPHPKASKTSVILSNLHRDDFVASQDSKSGLSFVDMIKLNILNLDDSDGEHFHGANYYLNNIEYWSSLPFLNRIIIIVKSEEAAERLYAYLTSEAVSPITARRDIKITLQENLLKRSKSFDSSPGAENSLMVTNKSLSDFKEYHNGKLGEYKEPEPQEFDLHKTLDKLGIPFDDSKTVEHPSTVQDESGVKRSGSYTRTLYKPDLKINTKKRSDNDKTNQKFPTSPTITLEESM